MIGPSSRIAVFASCLAAVSLLVSPVVATGQQLHGTSTLPGNEVFAKMRSVEASTPSGMYPIYTSPQEEIWVYSQPRRWTSGFLSGSLWYGYEATSDGGMRRTAEERQVPLARYAGDTHFMDVGFLLLSSYGNGYRLTGDASQRDVLLSGARSLATRYVPQAGVIRSFDDAEGSRVIIDTVMSTEILFWGARHGGGRALRTMASTHALALIRDHMRPDGSTYHYVEYDDAGEVVDKYQEQGAFDESTWARGQAWAIYGLTVAFRETGDLRFLDGAHRATDYWMGHIPGDMIPYWDFDAPGIPDEPRDSSAAAVAASAFVELSKLDPDATRRLEYATIAADTLATLSSAEYLSVDDAFPALLRHGTYRGTDGLADHGTIWGDYYYLEALSRVRSRVTRLGGPDRYATAVRTSQVSFEGADAVVLVSGENFPDAVSAASLAGSLGAPLLLTKRDVLPSVVAEEIGRLGAHEVVIVGGSPAVGSAVAAAADMLPGVSVRRVAGRDRYETAAAVAANVASSAGGTVFVARGDRFPDALAASPVSYAARFPVLLTPTDRLASSARTYLAQAGVSRVVIIGDSTAVSERVAEEIGTVTGASVLRVAGSNRYESATRFSRWAVTEGLAGTSTVGVATGVNFPDALVACGPVGSAGGILLLTPSAGLTYPTRTFLEEATAVDSRAVFFGSDAVLSGMTEFQVEQVLTSR